MTKKIPLVAITGPTATGKTALGIALARALSGEIVSCDSMQVYKGLEIGTAQPDEEERSSIPHHLIGFLSWDQAFSVSDYVSIANKVIQEIFQKGHMPLLVGGTGLYARSLLKGFSFKENCRSDELRAELVEEAQKLGSAEMHCRLAQLDPQSALEIHPHNVKRVLRALEYCMLSGEPFSRQAARSQEAESPYCYTMFCLTYRDRQGLYHRINARVDKMLKDGLLEEARRFYDFCISTNSTPTAAQSIGYKELFPYFRGEITLSHAIENIKQESRRYAKRQITWFNREEAATFLFIDELGGVDQTVKVCLEKLKQAQFI